MFTSSSSSSTTSCLILGGEEQLVERRLSEPEQVSVVQVFPTRLVLKFRDERDRGESVADQSRTGNTAGTEYLTALQIELLPVCVCVCVCVCVRHVQLDVYLYVCPSRARRLFA